MAQADLVVANQSGAAFRSDLNGQLLALGTLQSGASAPSTTFSYMLWADTTAGLLKIRDAANAAWVTVGTLGSTNLGLATLAAPTFTGTPAAPTAAAGTNTTQLATTAFVLANNVPAGAINYFAMSTAPTGYLKANGADISRTTYAALFAAISTTFGVGDGSTTFTLPDLRGEFVRGWADGRAVDTGRTFGSAQGEAFASHTHPYTTSYYLGSGSPGFDGNAISGNNVQGGFSSFAAIPTQNTGGTGGTETRPRNIALLACIKF
jgi:microcystin-dependent protein